MSFSLKWYVYLKNRGGDEIIVFGGGVIPNDDIEYLNQKGIEAVFTPGTPMRDVIDFIEANKARTLH